MQSVPVTRGGKDKDSIIRLRKDALRPVFYFSSAQAVSGILAFVLGIAVTALGAGSGKFPFNSGYGIWTGLTIAVGGVSGIILSQCDVDYGLPTPVKIRTWGGIYYGFCISGFSMFGISFGYSISAVILASNAKDDPSASLSNADQLQGLGITVILLSVVMAITSIYGFVFFIKKRKLFGFYSRGEQELLQRISSLENQVENLSGQNQEGYGTTDTGKYYGIDQTGIRQDNYNQWTEKPPEYSKS